jgi:hypothetical protein
VFTQVEELLPQATPLTAFAQRLAVQTWQAPQSTSLQQFPLTQVDPQWSKPVWHRAVEQVCPAVHWKPPAQSVSVQQALAVLGMQISPHALVVPAHA